MSAREIVLVLLLCAGCGDLADAYAHDPRVRAGPLALVLWALASWRARPRDPRPVWRTAALVAAVTGAILDVNAASHAGLALWLAGAAPRHRWLLLLTSVSWMPVLARAFPASPWACNVVRLLLAATPFTRGETR